MLASAVVPHPPILVPALAVGAAPALAPLLAACDTVVAGLLAESPQIVVLVGSGQRTTRRLAEDWGTLAGYGVVVEAPRVHAAGAARLPLSLTIGRWLLDRAGWTGPVLLEELAPNASAQECTLIGARLVSETGPSTAWLVLGDGSNRRGTRAPGQDDVRAGEFDASVATAFAAADLDALLGLDVALAAELGAVGRPCWQVLASAARSFGAAHASHAVHQPAATAEGATAATATAAGSLAAADVSALTQLVDLHPEPPKIDATVHFDDAPFGVEYLVVDWRFRP
jgi:hypothetical protein